ncbi:unnamed protein product [Ceutorhynchus assimilis]|uniref:RRM domain-containing protein n=1 Tax=Ceutorhynchus assimilis TaxID=467358 RepID=A0A9N9QM47_9CUCU|nr:unnamed protein product [Ceutorhynchus assimilis]
MADELDVEAMLEAPYRKSDEVNGKRKENGSVRRDRKSSSDKLRTRSRSRSRTSKKSSRSRSRATRDGKKRSRSREIKGSRDRRRTRSRDRKSRSRDRRSKSRSRDRRRSRSRNGSRSRDRRDRPRRRSRDRRTRSRDRRSRSKDTRAKSKERKKSTSPLRPPFRKATRSPLGLRGQSPLEELSSEERDARTVFCMQLSQRIRARDLEEFFSSVGKVRDVRMIVCNKTRRFKGIAYIEFKDPESVALALGLSGQKLMGVPIIVQHTQAEKNRMGNAMPNMLPKGMTGPMRLYVGSLHFNITEEMLRGIFEPFGKIENIQLIMDPETGRSKGYGFITFHNCEDAKKALEQLNGFELAGRPMKVGNVTERIDLQSQGPSLLDSDELDRSGIDLGATGRLQLMFKLAETAGMQVPAAAANALSMATGQPVVPQVQTNSTPPIATQCFMLSNMFDPATESNPIWDIEIRDDVIEECNKHGGVLHVYVDKGSPQGNVYVKCPSIATAVASVNSLHGRWFAGRVITAAYVPLLNYHSLFPDAMTVATLLLPSSRK